MGEGENVCEHIETVIERLDAVTLELASTLRVLWRRGDPEARTWIFLNFPGWAYAVAKSDPASPTFPDNPYIKRPIRPPE